MFIYSGKLNSRRGVLLSIATFIYSGKLTFDSAPSEMITVIFPKGFELSDPVIAFWSRSNDPKLDNKKTNVANYGFICTVAKASDGSTRRIRFSFDLYSFDGIVAADFQTLSLTMNDWMGSYLPFDLIATHVNVKNVPSGAVYTGSLTWRPHAKEEMVTIVVPYGVTKDAFFGLYHQWTRDPFNDTPQQNVAVNGRFQDVEVNSSDGCIIATYHEGGFKYRFKFNLNRDGLFVLSHEEIPGRLKAAAGDSDMPVRVQQQVAEPERPAPDSD
ncbi:hypothetical protein V8D89_003910 [Ganoderma adspersum]